MIGSDGSYEIIKRKDAYPTPLTEVYAPPQKQTSVAIRRGNATNRLRADCVGNTFALYINGQLVVVAEDPDAEFASGDVGLTMENLTSTLNEALFDHFVVVAPRAALPAPTRVPSGTVLLQEDFSDPARSNLPEGVQDDDSVLEYTSGGYRIFSRCRATSPTSASRWTSPNSAGPMKAPSGSMPLRRRRPGL